MEKLRSLKYLLCIGIFICTAALFCVTFVFYFTGDDKYFNHLFWIRKQPSKSSWIIRKNGKLPTVPITGKGKELYPSEEIQFPFVSPYVISQHNETVKNASRDEKWINAEAVSFKTIAAFKTHFPNSNDLIRKDFHDCVYDRCRTTHDIANADVVVFNMFKVKVEPNFQRRANQVWVFYTTEAPSRSAWFSMLAHPGYRTAMNLSVTFRRDSDVQNFYGTLVTNNEPHGKNYTAIYENKSRLAAWFVSHCKTRSERMVFVHRMMTRMDIDVFGECGNYSCRNPDTPLWGKSVREKADEKVCNPLLSSTYKFYLAFENTLCGDYVTEKFFKLFLGVNIVPVVRGGVDYKQMFPSDMFVDASDFSTPESLADHLVDLAADQARYVRYLKAKDRYRSVADSSLWRCKLCKMLHTMDHVSHENIHDWWTRDACFDPRDANPWW